MTQALAAMLVAALLLGLMIWLAVPCRPGDPAIYVGNVLMAGCPKR